jgi:hypothetical protein
MSDRDDMGFGASTIIILTPEKAVEDDSHVASG